MEINCMQFTTSVAMHACTWIGCRRTAQWAVAQELDLAILPVCAPLRIMEYGHVMN